GVDYNTDKLTTAEFIGNDFSYRNGSLINELADRWSWAEYSIAVEVYKGSVPMITLFFRHYTGNNYYMSNYADRVSNWFRYENLVNRLEEAEFANSSYFIDFSIAGSQSQGRSRWAIVNRQGRYIMGVPVSSASGSWESKARGRPIVLKDQALDPGALARMSDADILNAYGGDRLAVYIRRNI
ncbi:hypothetical protein EBT25_16535, partial [bacterium]|nr:hypothetical protein [bacterium]